MANANNVEQSQGAEILRVAVRVPPFWSNKVSLWFHQLEAQFNIAGIKSDETKFGYVVGNLEARYIEEVEDIICDPPTENKYQKIKAELIKRLSDSSSKRVRKLLESEELGDRTPSQFLRHLRGLADSDVPEDFLKTLWMNRLPTSTQRVLAASTEQPLASMAELADRVHEIGSEKSHIRPIYTASQSSTSPRSPEQAEVVAIQSEMTKMREELKQLREEIHQITTGRPHRYQPSRSRSRGRSTDRRRSSSQNNSDGFCWYHQQFAEKATKCREPCNFKQGNE